MAVIVKGRWAERERERERERKMNNSLLSAPVNDGLCWVERATRRQTKPLKSVKLQPIVCWFRPIKAHYTGHTDRWCHTMTDSKLSSIHNAVYLLCQVNKNRTHCNITPTSMKLQEAIENVTPLFVIYFIKHSYVSQTVLYFHPDLPGNVLRKLVSDWLLRQHRITSDEKFKLLRQPY